MIAKRRLAAMRRMHAEFLRVLDLSEQGDEEATEQVMVLGGALIGLMPALLDEVESCASTRHQCQTWRDLVGWNPQSWT